MSDRTSARIFGAIFKILAQNPTKNNKDIAKEVWQLSYKFKFSKHQMHCDDALVLLNLAEVEILDDGDEKILYKK